MANIDDFGIVKADVLKVINPKMSPHGLQIGNADSGTGGVGANGSWTVAAESWATDQWNDYYLVVDSVEYLITDTTATVLTVDEDLSGKSGAWAIRTAQPEYSDAEFTTLLEEQVTIVKAHLPHKYYEMLSQIDGEIIVECATAGQSSASLGFATSDATLVRLYRNYTGRWASRNRETDSMTQGASDDFTIDAVGKKTITFVETLSESSVICADYPHALVTVPKLLKAIAIRLIMYEIYQATLPAHTENIEVQDHKHKYPEELLAQLRDGKLAIAEFDSLKLMIETDRVDFKQYGSTATYRG